MKTRDKYSYFNKINKNDINSIGLMSGTSLDGLDIALIHTDALSKTKFGNFNTYNYSNFIKDSIRGFIVDRKNVNIVNNLLMDFHAKCINSFMSEHNIKNKDLDIIGLHGHTIFHSPEERWTWQLGNGKSLANLIKIPVISNFRYRDICFGGQGAPLVAIWHKALLGDMESSMFPCVFLNIGGVSNITYLENKNDIPYSFDIGVGNGPLDIIMKKYFNINFDINGKFSTKGITNYNSIKNILKNVWYKKYPPKSIDKNYFNDLILSSIKGLKPEDMSATLSKLISLQLKESFNFFSLKPKSLYISGGGAKNKAIIKGIKEEYGDILLTLNSKWNADAMEAQAFAYLAARSYKSIPYTWKKITGVSHETSGGLLSFP